LLSKNPETLGEFLSLANRVFNKVLSDIYKRVITHSNRAGIAVAELSYWVQDISRTKAYFVVFLQDVGAIYMMRYDFEHYQTVHTFLGSVVARRWHLGDFLAKSILLHQGDSLEIIHHSDAREWLKWWPRCKLPMLWCWMFFRIIIQHTQPKKLSILYKTPLNF
jgi:hypothetical protein